MPVVSLKKFIPCKCGANNSFDFNSDMQVEDITVSARCPSCGASITVSVSALFTPSQQPPAPSLSLSSAEPSTVQQANEEHVDRDTSANVEQAVRDLFR